MELTTWADRNKATAMLEAATPREGEETTCVDDRRSAPVVVALAAVFTVAPVAATRSWPGG
jgi:hypothetical protein